MSDDPWEPRVKCAENPELFEMSWWPDIPDYHKVDHWSPDRLPDTNHEFVDWVNMEKRKFEKAEELCLECPVFVQCGQTSNKNDRAWTVRAGAWPRLYVQAEKAPAHVCGIESHKPANGEGFTTAHCPKCAREFTLAEGRKKSAINRTNTARRRKAMVG